MSHLLKTRGLMKVSKGQSQPEIVAEFRLLAALHGSGITTILIPGFEQVTQMASRSAGTAPTHMFYRASGPKLQGVTHHQEQEQRASANLVDQKVRLMRENHWLENHQHMTQMTINPHMFPRRTT